MRHLFCDRIATELRSCFHDLSIISTGVGKIVANKKLPYTQNFLLREFRTKQTMQLQNNIKTMGVLALGLSSFVSAGDSYAPFHEEPTSTVSSDSSSSHHWCDALKSIGKLYKNPDNPIVQEFSVFGRLHYQGAWVDGEDANGDDFDDSFDEFRRVRVGAKAKIFRYFDILGRINLEDDRRAQGGDLDLEYTNFDEAFIGFDIKKAFGIDQLDKLHFSYGRHKFAISHEAVTSSKSILTVERSAISNQVFGNFRPTGGKLKAKRGPWDLLLGVYSTEIENEFVGGWGESQAYQGRVGYQYSDDLHFSADFVYNNGDIADTWQYKWATSLSAVYTQENWGIAADFIYGDNGDVSDGQNADRTDDFWGIVVIPHYWLVKDRLQAVGRYQYQGSDSAEGIRLNSRYVRRIDDAEINSGRGDSHHSFYAGLNYHLCGNNAKIQAGVEYDTIDTPIGEVDAVTWWLSFRTFF